MTSLEELNEAPRSKLQSILVKANEKGQEALFFAS
jgi:hypothetical protein